MKPPPTQLWEIEGVTLTPDTPESQLAAHAAKALGVTAQDLGGVEVVRRSIDARKKDHPLLRYTLRAAVTGARRLKPTANARLAAPADPLPPVPHAAKPARIAIVGAGPAGLFAALRLNAAGLRPAIIERGKAVEARAKDVQRLKRQRVLDEESNFCFGEGGAGTWSDGKLTTRIGDPRVRYVFEAIVAMGGPPEILVDGKPHLGTNRLVKLLRAIRAHLIASGVEFHFGERVEGFARAGEALSGLRLAGGGVYDCERAIFAPGHSARDVFSWLAGEKIALEPKAFAVGFRVEHPQALINEIQYGRAAAQRYKLPAADYRLTDNLEIDGAKRGVYSFCMCPGGVIVPTATEPNGLCINGMSHASRASPWANSAMVVTVEPEDFHAPEDGVLSGVSFQRRAEQAAFALAGSDFHAPAQRVADFLADRDSAPIEKTSYRPGVVTTPLTGIYPDFVSQALKIALRHWERRMRGLITNEAYLVGVETRTSSPVRIMRGDDLQSPSLRGLYPVGEGAGYAGGIVSAAVDGVRAADRIIEELQ